MATTNDASHAGDTSTSNNDDDSNNNNRRPSFSNSQTLSILSNTVIPLPPRTVGGIRDQILKAKRCKCKRSGCLKLYCECFNAGIVCNEACCCLKCNNVQYQYTNNDDNDNDINMNTDNSGGKEGDPPKHKDLRLTTIQTTLERNPDAFRPKVSSITHNSQREQEAKGELPSESAELELHERRAKKTKKKEEEKESLALAAFAISSGNASGSAVDHVEIPAVTSIGGVDANTVAMVSAGVAASGVDVFLPVSSYARHMKDENGKVVNEIAFGIVGRQSVGGKRDAADVKDGESATEAKGNVSSLSGQDDSFASLIEDVGIYREHFLAITKGSVHEFNKSTASTPLSNTPMTKKRSHEEFASGTIAHIMQELSGFKVKMDSAIVETREKIEETLLEETAKDEAMESSDQVSTDVSYVEKAPESTQALPNSNVKELYAIMAQDIALYNTLSDAIRERAKNLAKSRQMCNGVEL
eukprot:scaffold861_cov231-Chaetoceros_neogracile.AAC.3